VGWPLGWRAEGGRCGLGLLGRGREAGRGEGCAGLRVRDASWASQGGGQSWVGWQGEGEEKVFFLLFLFDFILFPFFLLFESKLLN
jgi:hypothetical protein